MYELQFSKVDTYTKLIKLLKLPRNYTWDKILKASVVGLYSRFTEIILKIEENANTSEAFVRFIEVVPFEEARYCSDERLKKAISNSLPYVLYNVAINPRDIKLKILCLADEEDSFFYEYYTKGKFDQYDLILSAGDLKKEYLEFIVTMSNKKLIYVNGNHDSEEIMGGICAEDDLIVVNGIRILGLGGSMKYSGGKNQYSEWQMRLRIFKLRRKIKKAGGVDIVLTHVPPRGYGDMEDLAHNGFSCFEKLLDKYEPKYMIHGHIHMTYGYNVSRIIEYKNTKIINAYKKYELDY